MESRTGVPQGHCGKAEVWKDSDKSTSFRVLKGSALLKMGCGCLDHAPSTVYVESCSDLIGNISGFDF